jgi:hypothetical protein
MSRHSLSARTPTCTVDASARGVKRPSEKDEKEPQSPPLKRQKTDIKQKRNPDEVIQKGFGKNIRTGKPGEFEFDPVVARLVMARDAEMRKLETFATERVVSRDAKVEKWFSEKATPGEELELPRSSAHKLMAKFRAMHHRKISEYQHQIDKLKGQKAYHHQEINDAMSDADSHKSYRDAIAKVNAAMDPEIKKLEALKAVHSRVLANVSAADFKKFLLSDDVTAEELQSIRIDRSLVVVPDDQLEFKRGFVLKARRSIEAEHREMLRSKLEQLSGCVANMDHSTTRILLEINKTASQIIRLHKHFSPRPHIRASDMPDARPRYHSQEIERYFHVMRPRADFIEKVIGGVKAAQVTEKDVAYADVELRYGKRDEPVDDGNLTKEQMDAMDAKAKEREKDVDFGFMEISLAPYAAIQYATALIASYAPRALELASLLPFKFWDATTRGIYNAPTMVIPTVILDYLLPESTTDDDLERICRSLHAALKPTPLDKECKWAINGPDTDHAFTWCEIIHPRVQQYTRLMVGYIGSLALTLQRRQNDLARERRLVLTQYQLALDAENGKEDLCIVCKKSSGPDDDSKLIVCDGCERYFHTDRCTDLKGRVPEGDWYCASCRPGGITENEKDEKLITSTILTSLHPRSKQMTCAMRDLLQKWIPEFSKFDSMRFRTLFGCAIPSCGLKSVNIDNCLGVKVPDHYTNVFDLFDVLSQTHARDAGLMDATSHIDARFKSNVEVINANGDDDDDGDAAKDEDADVEDVGFESATADLLDCGDNDDDDDDDENDRDYVPPPANDDDNDDDDDTEEPDA